MSSATSAHRDGELLQPRARKPNVPGSRQMSLGVEGVPEAGSIMTPNSGISSGRSTPVPRDAPPSVQATSSARKQRRAQQKGRLFPTIDYAPRVSHFDPTSDYRDFQGFFVLFWIGLAIMVITAMLRNLKEFGYPLMFRQWGLFTENIFELAISDGAMAASTALNLPLHKMYRSSGILRWNKLGMAVQCIFQAAWLGYWVSWPFVRTWTWTAQVFFTLHLMALFMKMHSYAFYNGHLSETQRRLSELDEPSTASKASVLKYPSSRTRLHEISQEDDDDKHDSNSQGDEHISHLREDLAFELTSPLGQVTYPQNLTLTNYVDFLFCPTLCYELEYPRTEGIRYMELFYKTLAVFGCIFLLTVTSEEFIIPVLDESALRLQNVYTLSDRALIMAETVSRLLFPFMVTFLLVFLVIFEYVLGAFAEITCFADRLFYADWWNSCDWLEFSREWNIPVHHFFRRHVYSASRPHLSRPLATLITFLISALAHELVMGCITKKLRGYGFFAMMLQMPIVMVQRSRWIRGRTLLNNTLFWCSMILGLSAMCALYVLV
ncbi:hypothetical protein K402DRAFT_396218 [Aulographum hederae CBS 113979]|uniref:O-acyltransferase n=1 Tax=Aulographum hederae CBS 113979 TaxID=1176131 RepID=A0A6G1GSU4_9PEZI|nr:hypothetical protein K402DRAFT_396218 [Aulographum hederae CBS 113979]